MAVQQNKKSPSRRGMHRSHDHVAQPAQERRPAVVVGQHAAVQHLGVGEQDVGVGAGPLALLDRAVAVVGGGDQARQLEVGGDGWEIVLEELDTARTPFVAGETFAEARERVAAEFGAYVETSAPWRSAATPALPEPMNGSATTSPGCVLWLTSTSDTAAGFSAG